jgi:hypothetical protein
MALTELTAAENSHSTGSVPASRHIRVIPMEMQHENDALASFTGTRAGIKSHGYWGTED